MAVERTLLGPYPHGVTSETISEWLLRGNRDASLPPEGPLDDELPTETDVCPNCGLSNTPGKDGCHQILCGASFSR